LNASEEKLKLDTSLSEITRLAHLEADRRMLNNGSLVGSDPNDLLAPSCNQHVGALVAQEQADWEVLRMLALDAARSKDAEAAQTCLLASEALAKIHAGLREALNV
jgi:hypothetical protein